MKQPTADNFRPQLYFLEHIDDQLAGIMQATANGKSARLEIPRDGDQYQRFYPLLGAWLLQGKKMLITAPSEYHLKKINKVLAEKGLSPLVFTLEDSAYMKQSLQDKLSKEQPISSRSTQEGLKILKKKCERLETSLETQYNGLLYPAFDRHNRQNLIAAYVSAHQVKRKSWLAGLIPAPDMVFSMEVFTRMKKAIRTAEKQYRGQLDHPLGQLHARFFLQEAEVAAVEKIVSDLLKKGQQLRSDFLQRIDQYQTKLQSHYDQHYQECAYHLRELIYLIEDIETETQGSIAELGGLAPKKSIFGIKQQAASDEARQLIVKQYKILRQVHQQYEEIDFELPPARSTPNPVPLLNQYQSALIDWHQHVPALMREQLIRLNTKTVHPATEQTTEIQQLEVQLSRFVAELNELELFDKHFSNNSLTLLQQQELLNQILQQLEATQQALPDFPDFTNWQQHWLQSEATTQKIILQLVRNSANDWVSIFESWFWYQSLLNLSSRDLPRQPDTIQQLKDLSRQLSNLLPGHLIREQRKQSPSPKQLAHQTRKLQANSRWEIIQLAQQYFPVILCRETDLDELIINNYQTDCLLVIEAPFLAEKNIRTLAKQFLLSGDAPPEKSMPSATLWQNPRLGSIEYFRLGITTNKVPLSLSFYLASQYGQITKANQLKKWVELVPVMGRTSPADNSNEAEARQIIQYLHQLQKQKEGHPPRNLLILCATQGQQRHINHYLEESLRRQVAGADWLATLRDKGLQIMRFDELKGQQSDRVIISLVTDGNPECPIADRSELGERLAILRSMLSASSGQLTLFHSLPEEKRKDWLQSAEPDKQLIANWLAYTRAVAKSIGSQQEHFLKKVAHPNKQAFPGIPLIYRAIAQALLVYFPAGRILLGHQFGALFVPLVIRPETTNEVPVMVIVDQVVRPYSRFPWLETFRLQQSAHRQGLEVVETWSVQWWQDPEQAARQLAGKIMRSGKS